MIRLTTYNKFQDQFLPHDLNQAVVSKDHIVLVVFLLYVFAFFFVNLSIVTASAAI